MTEPSSLEPSIALAAYAEPLASNRRVLVFGNALGSLPLQLLERGARSIHVCDPDALRVSEAAARNRSTQISFSTLADSDLSLREGAFDLALIDNLGAYDPLSVIRTAKRALAGRGVAVIACPNPEAAFPLLRQAPSAQGAATTSLDYYALYDAVASEFEHVRMLGQTPFVGYAIADFSASGEPEPALDTSFVPGGAEEPDFFIALASNQEVRLDEFAVIQLPTRRVLVSVNTPLAVAPALPRENLAQTKAHDAELIRLNQWIKELESRASTADERADHSETELEAERAKFEAEHAKFEAEHAKFEAEHAKFEAEHAKFEAEHAKFEAEHQTSAALKSQHEREISAVRAELNALRTQATNLRAEASNKANELQRVTSELAERNRQLAEQTEKLEQGSGGELAEFERQLSERGSEVRRLEQDLRTAERTGRELVRELERRTSEQSLQASLELERALAEREADLQAAAWTIESLSLRLELAGKPAAVEGPLPETTLAREEAR